MVGNRRPGSYIMIKSEEKDSLRVWGMFSSRPVCFFGFFPRNFYKPFCNDGTLSEENGCRLMCTLVTE